MLKIQENVPLAPFTTFHIGGEARFFAETNGTSELAEALEYAEKKALSVCVLGGGSNVIFSDKGFAGLVIRLRDSGMQISGEKIICGAGVSLFDLVRVACDAGLSGIENLAGIPGSLGGAIRGNAGAFGMSIGDKVSSVKVFTQNTGMMKEYKKDECEFGYRTSVFKKNQGLIIISAEIKLERGDKDELKKIANEIIAKREAKHPQSAKCAGSFFINPIVKNEKLREEFMKDTGLVPKGDTLPAGWMIDYVGLRGKKVGGAMVSGKHPNYLINTGNATAEDVMILASLIKTRVRNELGVRLQEEVQFVGF
jgi:UDP-N-acetylmuramate dehydrogenase